MVNNILLISTLVIIWWIAIWGLIDIFLKHTLGNSTKNYISAYSLMALGVLIIVYEYPSLLQSFI
jgi:hypothetical protein